VKAIPESGFSRLKDIVGNPRAGKEGYFPISAATWWRGVREGRYPKPVKLSARTTAWENAKLRQLETDMALGRLK
jgi:prophage regulatory protein